MNDPIFALKEIEHCAYCECALTQDKHPNGIVFVRAIVNKLWDWVPICDHDFDKLYRKTRREYRIQWGCDINNILT